MLILNLTGVALERFVFLITSFFISINPTNKLAIYINLLSPYIYIMFGYICIFSNKKIANNFGKELLIVLYFAIIYFLLWMLMAFFLAQNIKDIIGSTIRVLIPFLTILVLLNLYNNLIESIRYIKFLKLLIIIFIISDSLAAIIKTGLLLSDTYYGGGINQFSISIFLLSWMIFFIFNNEVKILTRKLFLFVLLIFILLSFLSFKRAVFLEIIFSILLVIIFGISKRFLLKILFVGFVFICVALFLFNSDYGELIFNRIMYSFEGNDFNNSYLDISSYTRVAELNSAIFTLNQFNLSWFTGLGPGAGYENPDNFDFENLNSSGKPFHIHSGIGIMLFRYGIIGVIFHLYFIILNLRCFLFFGKSLRDLGYSDIYDIRVIGFSAALVNVISLLSLFLGNVFFGSFLFGLFTLVALSCVKLANK